MGRHTERHSSRNNTNLSRLLRKAEEEGAEPWRRWPAGIEQVGVTGGMSHCQHSRGTGTGRQGQEELSQAETAVRVP